MVLNLDLKKALGLDSKLDNWQEVVFHLDKLIALWQESVSSKLSLPKHFDKSIQKVYKFFAIKSIISEHKDWLKDHFDNMPCLWNGREFLLAKNTFQTDVSYLQPWRIQFNAEKLGIQEFSKVLGQKLAPDINDYLDLVKEISEAADGQPLDEDETKCVIKLLRQIAHEVDGNPSILYNWNLPLLTEDLHLLDAEYVIVPDAPWRLRGIREMGVISSSILKYPLASPV